jgi:DNA polymerase III delta subunit
MAKNMQVTISDAAAERLAVFLGRDLFEEKKFGGRVVERKEAFDLWQVNSELQKLSAKTDKIESKDVSDLVRAKVPDSVFALTDEIVAHNQKGAFDALENFLSAQTAEEKQAFIKIIGLLSDQVRSLLAVSIMLKQGMENADIAERLGWSSGRVFITARNIRNASFEKLKILLGQLLMIDAKIKSSDANPKLLVNLFITQAVN